MSRTEAMRALQRRLDYLVAKVAEGRGSEGALSFDRAEIVALRMAMEALASMPIARRAPPCDKDNLAPVEHIGPVDPAAPRFQPYDKEDR